MRKFILAVALLAFSLSASALRCPSGKLVRTGDDMFAVIEACGQNMGEISMGGVNGPTKTMWRYDFGHGMTHILTFKGSILVNITSRR